MEEGEGCALSWYETPYASLPLVGMSCFTTLAWNM